MESRRSRSAPCSSLMRCASTSRTATRWRRKPSATRLSISRFSSRPYWSIITFSLVLAACTGGGPKFKSTDITGVDYGKSLELADTRGRVRHLEDFRGKAVVVFFGFTHCPDVCPTTLADLARVMQDLGPDADRAQVLFITVDPERERCRRGPDALEDHERQEVDEIGGVARERRAHQVERAVGGAVRAQKLQQVEQKRRQQERDANRANQVGHAAAD